MVAYDNSMWINMKLFQGGNKCVTLPSQFIKNSPHCVPPALASLHKVMLLLPVGQVDSRWHFGIWTPDGCFLIQYQWADATPLLGTLTLQLQGLQAPNRLSPHSALSKWESDCSFPSGIWNLICIKYRGAYENMAFQVIATHRWRFLALPADDPITRCTRCDENQMHYITRCLLSCRLSQICWLWGRRILQVISNNRHSNGGLQVTLTPAHIFIGQPLPADLIYQKYSGTF